MKNPSGRRGRLWFWSGVILLSISASLWLMAILGATIDPEVDLVSVIEGLVLLTFIPIGLGIYCVKRARKSRRTLWFWSGVILIVTGAWAAIGMLPALFVSVVVFALIGGPGVLISYKLKRIRSTLLWGLGVPACGYFLFSTIAIPSCAFHGTSTNYYTKTDVTLFFGSLITVVPIAVLGTLAIAWLGRNKLSLDSKTLSAFKKLVPFTLLIATFIIGGLSDYNYRGDPNPQVINLRIVDKWIGHEPPSDGVPHDIFMVKGETLDGSSWFSFPVSTDFYNEHDIGSYCWIRVRSGALGYACISRLTYGD